MYVYKYMYSPQAYQLLELGGIISTSLLGSIDQVRLGLLVWFMQNI